MATMLFRIKEIASPGPPLIMSEYLNKKYLFAFNYIFMGDLEKEAVDQLANLPPDEDQYTFQPFKSSLLSRSSKNQTPKQRPLTVQPKANRPSRSLALQNKRQELKKQLKILEQVSYDRQTPKNEQRVVTSQSLYCMAGTPTLIKSQGFPSHPIKKSPGQRLGITKLSNFKENVAPRYSRINPEELIREDIMKKFKLRESVRQNDKLLKINNFLKMTTTSKGNAVPIFFKKKDEKFKITLTNLLS